jgi:hypothetical protein
MLFRKNMNHMMHHVITVLHPYLFLVFIKKMATMLVPLSGKHSVLLNTYSVYYIKYVFRK